MKVENNKQNEVFNKWERPIPLDMENLPIFDSSVFPNWIQNYVEEVAKTVQVAVDVPSFFCISLLSTILSKQYEIDLISHKESLNTYTLLSLPVGERKSAVLNYFLKFVIDFEINQNKKLGIKQKEQLDWIRAQEQSIEQKSREYARTNDKSILKQIKHIRRDIETVNRIKIPRLFTDDATPEVLAKLMKDHGGKMAILTDEGGEVIQMMLGMYSNKSNLKIYLDGYNGAPISVDRLGREIQLKSGLLTIGLAIQPIVLKQMQSYLSERGITQRFIYSLPKPMAGKRVPYSRGINAEIDESFSKKINKLLELNNKNPIPLKLTKEAEEYKNNKFEEIERSFNRDLPDSYKGWLNRLLGFCLRIAGIIHVTKHISCIEKNEQIPKFISKKTLEKAFSLKEYLKKHAKAAYGLMEGDKDKKELIYLLEHIIKIADKKEDAYVIDYREVQMATRRRFPKARDLQKTLRELEELHYIKNSKFDLKKIIQINPMARDELKNVHNVHKRL